MVDTDSIAEAVEQMVRGMALTSTATREAKEERGMLEPPALARAQYAAFYRATQEEQKGKFKLQQTIRPPFAHGAPPPLASLRSTSLHEVVERVNAVHRGQVLYVTVIDWPPLRTVGTNVLVMDDCGDVIHLSLYNYVYDEEDPDDVLPVGTSAEIKFEFRSSAT